jgi:nucleotide-binding universal stress UspA family protein
MFKNILIPVDGSDYSYNAVQAGAAIAEKFGGRIQFLHVIDLSALASYSMGGAMLPTLSDTMIAEWQRNGEEILQTVKSMLGADADTHRYELVWGSPAQVIAEKAAQGCNLIVMGSRGKGAISEFFLGSVSHRISHTVNCPVLLVKDIE